MYINELVALLKKLVALSKEKDCKDLVSWAKSIVNHLYYTAAAGRSPEHKVAIWTSVVNHVQNVHKHNNPLFKKCLHQRLTPDTNKQWLKPRMYTC